MDPSEPASFEFDPLAVYAAHWVLGVRDLEANLEFFRDRLGFRLESIYPADSPRHILLSGYGLRLALRKAEVEDRPTLQLRLRDSADPVGASSLCAPNGSRIEFVADSPSPALPPNVPEFVLSRLDEGSAWNAGRAGMRYRDLIPGRQGGRFIASHIQILEDGPVPDYVHFHQIRFQLIYCHKGWARLVYEDQGEPFVMRAGDCVLQPPQIRHRVLESGDGLEVIELASPAEHHTRADDLLHLPNPELRREREFGGQRFVFHQSAHAVWQPWRLAGFECRDLGFAAATHGLLSAQVLRPQGQPEGNSVQHDGEFLFFFVLRGRMRLDTATAGSHEMGEGDSVTIPPGECHRMSECGESLELLEVRVDAELPTKTCPLDGHG